MKMVQKKVANNKLGFQASNLKTEKKQSIIQTHDGKSKGADLKAIKMKKSRSMKRSNVDISLQSSPEIREAPQQPGKPPPFVTPTNTPSPKKSLHCKSPNTSPNYMKSTSSSEARKEKTSTKVSNTTSTSKLHRIAKSFNKISSLKKMRTLTKTPSFKHTKPGTCKKVVLCHSDLDVQRATCSSTLKDSKFPNYLKLKPGATEAEGNSVFKVCPYNYCSLNGHHHISAPPLKRFLSSRRRLLKTLKVRPEVLSPRKPKPSEYNKAIGEGDPNEDFFVKIYVPDREAATQVSESLSDGPCSEMEFQDDLDETEDTNLSCMNFSPEDEGYPSTPLQKQKSFESQSSSSVSLDELFGESTDMEWVEGQSPTTHSKCEIHLQIDYSTGHDKPDYELSSSASEYLKFLADAYSQYSHDEIVECLSFSDTDSMPDSESTQTGDKHIELQLVTDSMSSEPKNEIMEVPSLANEATVCDTKLEDESTVKQGKNFTYPFEGITEDQKEELDHFQDLVETDNDDPNEENYEVEEIREDAADFIMEERGPNEETIKDIPQITDNVVAYSTNEDSGIANNVQAETDQSGSWNDSDADASHNITNEENFFLDKGVSEGKNNEADNGVSRRSANFEAEEDSNTVGLHSDENNDVEVDTSGMPDHHKTEEADASPVIGYNMQKTSKCVSNNSESDSDLKFLESCCNSRRSLRCRNADEDNEEGREFNPRGPNFLTEEPDPEAEKVDLRHQEMDERRNAKEWMLDYALQKTVNQLAPARKRKVALLVEAFESVLPIPKFESHVRRNISVFAHGRTIQACS